MFFLLLVTRMLGFGGSENIVRYFGYGDIYVDHSGYSMKGDRSQEAFIAKLKAEGLRQ